MDKFLFKLLMLPVYWSLGFATIAGGIILGLTIIGLPLAAVVCTFGVTLLMAPFLPDKKTNADIVAAINSNKVGVRSRAEASKICPQCAEEVKSAAKVCKHCDHCFPA